MKKLIIRSNGKLNEVKTTKYKNGEIDSVEITFTESNFYSDLEMWLETLDNEYLDYIKFCITKRDKIKTYKK
nr:MAG TPA: hypothetical protein [Caudoviricetes sp.]